MRQIAAGLALSLVLASPTLAESLQGKEIVETVSGKRVYLSTPFGGEFPLFYKPNGSVSGDGTKLGLGKYFAPKETGRWWVDGTRLCQKWPTWYRGKTSCFEIRPAGPGAIFWTRDDGAKGKARVEG